MPTLIERGDALRGDRLAINARRISRPGVIARSGRHQTQSIVARDKVYCVIEMPLRARSKGHRRGRSADVA
jgi:hypothetical protein